MIILLHSSKSMRCAPGPPPLRPPRLIEQAQRIDAHLKTLSQAQIERMMRVSPALAAKTQALIADWNADPARQSLALDSFTGDIYSGLHANDLSAEDRQYADQTLHILSGLYGLIRPFDGITPYRLEMGYALPGLPWANLVEFWGSAIADCLPAQGPIVNLAAVEYAQSVTPYIDPARIRTPRFLTLNPKSGQPAFVVVHAKIARGAFARWMITARIRTLPELGGFTDLGYQLDAALSTPESPTFVCETFGGKGLSIRRG